MISTVGVVIPAHNEEELLPACLDALGAAIEQVRLPVRVAVVLDDCHDGSWEVVATRSWARALELRARNVGVARAAGFGALLKASGGVDPDRIWLASSDADSRVPRDWLAVQLEYAELGFDAVLGTIRVEDWSGRPPEVPANFVARYQPGDDHPHVHGANLGLSGAAYLRAGGVPSLQLSEDHGLARGLAGRRICRTGRIPVTTSGRVDARARGGFASYLDALAASDRPESPLSSRPAPRRR
ncbi:MAG: glycosyltransferase [Candidatus Dormibacteria bacterium]